MVYLYCNAKKTEYREAQRERLRAEHPDGQPVTEGTGAAKWERLRESAAAGDLIIAESLRNIPAADLAADYEAIIEAGADIAFKKEPGFDSTLYRQAVAGREPATAAAIMEYLKMQIQATAAAAGAEAEAHRARTRAALEAATAAGRNPGRKAGKPQSTWKESHFKQIIQEMQAQGMTTAQIVNQLDEEEDPTRHLSHNTARKYIKALEAKETGAV